MKINLKFGQKQEPVSTGLRVKTLVRAGECGCAPVRNAGWQCDDGKGMGNEKMVWSETELWSWMGTYCPRPDPLLKMP